MVFLLEQGCHTHPTMTLVSTPRADKRGLCYVFLQFSPTPDELLVVG